MKGKVGRIKKIQPYLFPFCCCREMKGKVERVEEIQPYLPQDILRDILLRLPAKSLIRSKCVCKSWCSIISDPDFEETKIQQLMSKVVILYLVVNGGTDYKYESFRLQEEGTRLKKDDVLGFNYNQRVWTEGFCDNLVLFRTQEVSGSVSKLHVYDVLSHQRKQLPQTPRLNDPYRSLLVYDASRQQYKVLVFEYDFSTDVYWMSYCYIFTLNHQKDWKSENWRMTNLPNFLILEPEPVLLNVAVNGVLYWVARSPKSFYLAFIQPMDIRTEKLMRIIELPCDDESISLSDMRRSRNHLLSEMKGSLCLVKGCSPRDKAIYIWLLKDSAKSHWVKQHKISHSSMVMVHGLPSSWNPNGRFFPRLIVESCNTAFVLIYQQDELYWYNVENQELRHIALDPDIVHQLHYKPSIFSFTNQDRLGYQDILGF